MPPQHTHQPFKTNYSMGIENAVDVNRLEPADLHMLRFNLFLATLAKHVQGLHKKDLEDAARARRNKQRLNEVVTIETHLGNVVATFWHKHPVAHAARSINEVDAIRLLRAHVDIAVRKLELRDDTLILRWVDYTEKQVQDRYKDHIPFMMRIMVSHA